MGMGRGTPFALNLSLKYKMFENIIPEQYF